MATFASIFLSILCMLCLHLCVIRSIRVCQDTKECVGEDLIDADKIYCSSFGSCSSTHLSADHVVCDGNLGCSDANIESDDTTNCEGHRSCYSANIKSLNNVYCDGKYVCQYASISAANVYIYGDYGANYANIDSQDFKLINIYSTGHLSGSNANIYCRSGSICNVYCFGSGCLNVNYFCFQGSKCLYNCNEANHCPVVYENANIDDEDLNVIVETKSKEKERSKALQDAKLQAIEQEKRANMELDTLVASANENESKHGDDKATLVSTLIVIAELVVYSCVIVLVTYYCCSIRDKAKVFNFSPLLVGFAGHELQEDDETYLK